MHCTSWTYWNLHDHVQTQHILRKQRSPITFLFVDCSNQAETNSWWSWQSSHDMPWCSEEIECGVPPKFTLNSASPWVMDIWNFGCYLSFPLISVTRPEEIVIFWDCELPLRFSISLTSVWHSVRIPCDHLESHLFVRNTLTLILLLYLQPPNHNYILLKSSCSIIDDFWSLYTIIKVCYTCCCLVYLVWLELHILHPFLGPAVWASCTRFGHLVPCSTTPSWYLGLFWRIWLFKLAVWDWDIWFLSLQHLITVQSKWCSE